jgi:hypothetical protein
MRVRVQPEAAGACGCPTREEAVIDFERVLLASENYWSDVECCEVRRQVERLSLGEWKEFERQCLLLPYESQDRMANVLGDVDTAASARVLLQLCTRSEREAVLTAREAVRSLSFPSVKQAALDLWASSTGSTTNEILEWIEGHLGKQS